MSSYITVCIAAKNKSTSSSLSCVFDLSPLPVLYCLSCAETLRRRLGLHELRYVAVLLSAVNNDSRNAVLAATDAPQENIATPLMCFGSIWKEDGLDRKSCNMSLKRNLLHVLCAVSFPVALAYAYSYTSISYSGISRAPGASYGRIVSELKRPC